MPPLGPTKRRVIIKCLRTLGFEGPYAGKRHPVMVHPDGRWVTIPNPHAGDPSLSLVLTILKQAQVDPNVWELL